MSAVFRLAAICFAFVGIVIGICALIGGDGGLELTNLVLSGLVFHISLSLFFAFRSHDWSLNRVEGCLLLAIVWAILPVPVGISLAQSMELSLIDAYFEATSALTTTGASIFSNVENLPPSVLFLRGIVQWLGGLLSLIGIFMIFAPMGLGGLPTKQSTFLGHQTGASKANARHAAYTIATGYLLLTALCFLLLVITQVPICDAFLLTLATVSSGGLISSATPISEIGNAFTSYVIIVFMILAGSSIIWQRNILAGHRDSLKNHRETYYYFAAIAVFGFAFSITFFDRAGSADVLTPGDALSEGFFTAASLISTTGFEIRNSSFSVLPATIILALVLIGGCSFSTAGGISFFRVGAMFSHSFKDLTRLVYPNSVYRSHFGTHRFNLTAIKAVWTYFFSVTAAIMLGTLFLSLRLNDFEASFIASTAAFSNIGAFYATGWNETGQWLEFGQMDGASKLVLCLLMILGRLHILALFIAFNRTYWLQSR